MDAGNIESWICAYLQKILGLTADQVDPLTGFDELGLDSAAAIGLVGELEEWVELELDPTLAYDFPNARALAGTVAAMLAEKVPVAAQSRVK